MLIGITKILYNISIEGTVTLEQSLSTYTNKSKCIENHIFNNLNNIRSLNMEATNKPKFTLNLYDAKISRTNTSRRI